MRTGITPDQRLLAITVAEVIAAAESVLAMTAAEPGSTRSGVSFP
ncbi:MAG TPA: hypothetical protein VFQ44_02805 [Streptosporangiaceae bacterium]|nr:hypothetical protein [Streptosporangiaceae bacterium]